MKKTLATLLLIAVATAAHARDIRDEQKATPNPRTGGAICLAGLTECLPMTQSAPDTIVAGDMKLAAAMASSAPGYPLSITTSNPKRNVLNGSINECVVSAESMVDMTVCMANHGYLVTGYVW